MEETDPVKAKHKKRVAARFMYLSTLTSDERRIRDDYIAWVRWWRREYAQLVLNIQTNKKFIRTYGHNNTQNLKLAMQRLHGMSYRARTMLMARVAAKAVYRLKLVVRNRPPAPPFRSLSELDTLEDYFADGTLG